MTSAPSLVPTDPELGKPAPTTNGNVQDPSKAPPKEIPWGPAHPCYPHPNPHVPLSSPLHTTTRIIRIKRDWMIAGDLAPTFSNIYPEILEPWVSEADFRTLIQRVNDGLLASFHPGGWRAWMDAVMGVATGWIWEDLGLSGVKSGVRRVEQYIEEWNGMESKGEEDGDIDHAKVIPLRRTGFLSLDIQIPDPHVGLVEREANSRESSRPNSPKG